MSLTARTVTALNPGRALCLLSLPYAINALCQNQTCLVTLLLVYRAFFFPKLLPGVTFPRNKVAQGSKSLTQWKAFSHWHQNSGGYHYRKSVPKYHLKYTASPFHQTQFIYYFHEPEEIPLFEITSWFCLPVSQAPREHCSFRVEIPASCKWILGNIWNFSFFSFMNQVSLTLIIRHRKGIQIKDSIELL